MQKYENWIELGGKQVATQGLNSTTLVQASYPVATVTVFYQGTGTRAPIFSDNNAIPTPLANPLTTDAEGYFYFYAANGRYDVVQEGGSPVMPHPFTHYDVTLLDVTFQNSADISFSQTNAAVEAVLTVKPLDIGIVFSGAINNSFTINHVFPFNATIPAGLTNSMLYVGTAPTSDLVFSLYKNGGLFGVVTIAAGDNFASSFVAASATLFNAGTDIFTITVAGPDATASDIGGSIYGARS